VITVAADKNALPGKADNTKGVIYTLTPSIGSAGIDWTTGGTCKTDGYCK